MINEIWINLPVKNVKKTVDFFGKLGFKFNENQPITEISASMQIGKNKTIIMLFDEKVFSGFAQSEVADTQKSAEILISMDVDNKEIVDDYFQKAKEAGAKIYGEPSWNQGWIYGFGFVDIDFHRWNIIFMDLDKMPN